MKRFLYGLAIAVAASCSLNSCIGDLDTLPLNETDKTAGQAYQTIGDFEKGLAYVYGSFSLTSQNDPGSADIAVDDAGQSELVRQYLILNEMSVDALKCTWGDSYIADLQNNSWSATPNSATLAVYTRCMMAVTRANEFLNQSANSSLEGIGSLRAEARFVRALSYFLLMDFYGNPPFALEENIGGALPEQIKRKDLFDWIEKELNSIVKGAVAGEQLGAKGTVDYPRADQGAATALLARMYLNAEVYTGTAKWEEAKTAAKSVIDMGYSLCPNYEELFEQDNGENDNARKEMIYSISYDRDNAQSWGGTTHLVSASLDDNASMAIAKELGFPEGSMITRERWNGYHVPSSYVENFELSGVTWNAKSGFGYDRANSDKRAFLYNIGCKEAYDKADINTGWRCWKYSSRDSKGNLFSSDSYSKLSSIDFPMFRLAEMYLVYAEAQARIDGGVTTDATAVGYIKALRTRAGLETSSSVNLDFILKERACELMWEGHRRTDLIRYGYFTSAQFPWPYKGGVPDGKTALPSYTTIYPILQTDLNENPNLKQNEGY